MNEEIKLLNYDELLTKISGRENNLLIGNGFNRGLGVNTSYQAIFEKMIKETKIYADVKDEIEKLEFDLENFIALLSNKTDDDFVKKYLNNKIKKDFMSATQEIVKESIKKIKGEENEGIHIFLRNFNKYFTLNYDSFLYMLLLKFKNEAVAFDATVKQLSLFEDDKNNYDLIKEAYDGYITINANQTNIEKDISQCRLDEKVDYINQILEKEGRKISKKDIKKNINLIEKEEKPTLDFDDGFLFNNTDGEMQYNKNFTKNLHFLHGAFHIYQSGDKNIKISSDSDRSLYKKIEDAFGEKNVVCVFKPTNKMDEIVQNEYLSDCLQNLENISGDLVILGSSLAENDGHIFSAINKSKVENLYISTSERDQQSTMETAKKIFENKQLFLFDHQSISYSKES